MSDLVFPWIHFFYFDGLKSITSLWATSPGVILSVLSPPRRCLYSQNTSLLGFRWMIGRSFTFLASAGTSCHFALSAFKTIGVKLNILNYIMFTLFIFLSTTCFFRLFLFLKIFFTLLIGFLDNLVKILQLSENVFLNNNNYYYFNQSFVSVLCRCPFKFLLLLCKTVWVAYQLEIC